MEYGWNRVLPGSENDERGETMSTRSARSIFSKRSLAGSLKDRNGSPFSDRLFINDWKPPLPPSIPSSLDEESQLVAMEKQVAALNEELENHQAVQFAMTELVSLGR
jgi:PH/SEC7 domain-containing protein